VVRKKLARPDYERPRNPDGIAIDTGSAAAISIKCSAALALGVFLDNIRTTHAHDGALVSIDVDLSEIALMTDRGLTQDWTWLLYGALAVYLVLLHVIAMYFAGGGLWMRVRARFVISRSNVATQCSRLPDITFTTVEGLRSELRACGLKKRGLRAELEQRLSLALAESEQ